MEQTLTSYCRRKRISQAAFPPAWRAECRDYMLEVCLDRNIKTGPVEFYEDREIRSVHVDEPPQLRKERTFPVSILDEIVQSWLLRKNDQMHLGDADG